MTKLKGNISLDITFMKNVKKNLIVKRDYDYTQFLQMWWYLFVAIYKM